MSISTEETVKQKLVSLQEGNINFQIGLLLVHVIKNSNTWQNNLLMWYNQRNEEKNINLIYQMVPTPLDPTQLLEGILSIKASNIGEHALQVNTFSKSSKKITEILFFIT